MTEERKSPYCWVTWLASIMAGEQSCLWRSWFMTQHQNYKKANTDSKFTASWNIKHTTLLHKTVDWLQCKGMTGIKVEQDFKYERHGVCLAGKTDIVGTLDGELVIYDPKSGRPKHSHHLQVMVYMYVLKADRGYLIYEDEVVEVAQPDEAFFESFDRNLRMLGSGGEPFKAPSERECRYCKLTSYDCKEKVE